MVDADPEPYLRLLRRHHPRISKSRTSPTSSTACSSPLGDAPPRSLSAARGDASRPVVDRVPGPAFSKAAAELDLGNSFGASTTILSPAHFDLVDACQQCPHCTRMFSKEAAERHIPICSQLRTRPKPPVKEQSMRFTDSLGRRQRSTGSLANSISNVSTPSRSLRTPPKPQERPSSRGPARRLEEHGNTGSLAEQWMLVQLLLRDVLESMHDDTTICNTLRTAEDCLTFLENLEEWAKQLQLRKGALSRMLLPFDSETSSGDQASTACLAPLGSKELDGRIPDEDRRYLVAQAIKLRRLVRVKVADCADVEQARESLRLLANFLQGLKQKASKEERSLASILREL